MAPPTFQPRHQGAVAVFVSNVPFMHEHARHGARAGVDVFVGAPAGEVDVPVVQLKRYVAYGVGQIKPTGGTHRMRGLGDGLEVVPLPGVVVHPAHHHGGEFVAGLRDCRQPIFFPDEVLSPLAPLR